MYRLTMSSNDLQNLMDSAKENSLDGASGLFGGYFSVIDEDSRKHLVEIVNDIGGASNSSELKQAYMAYMYLGLACGVPMIDIMSGIYSNSQKNFNLGFDPDEWFTSILDAAGMIHYAHHKQVKEVTPMAAANMLIGHKSTGGCVPMRITHKDDLDGILSVFHEAMSSVKNSFIGLGADDVEMFVDDEYYDMIGDESPKASRTQPETVIRKPKGKLVDKQTKAEKQLKGQNDQKASAASKELNNNGSQNATTAEVTEIVPNAAANTMTVAPPTKDNAGPSAGRMDFSKFFTTRPSGPKEQRATLNINTIPQEKQLTFVQQQYLKAQQNPHQDMIQAKVPVAGTEWVSNPMDDTLLTKDMETKIKVVKDHVHWIPPKEITEYELNSFITFLTGERFKSETAKKNVVHGGNNPHLTEVPIEPYMRPGNEGKYDTAFKMETSSGQDLIILYSMAGTTKRGGKHRNHGSAFFLVS